MDTRMLLFSVSHTCMTCYPAADRIAHSDVALPRSVLSLTKHCPAHAHNSTVHCMPAPRRAQAHEGLRQ